MKTKKESQVQNEQNKLPVEPIVSVPDESDEAIKDNGSKDLSETIKISYLDLKLLTTERKESTENFIKHTKKTFYFFLAMFILAIAITVVVYVLIYPRFFGFVDFDQFAYLMALIAPFVLLAFLAYITVPKFLMLNKYNKFVQTNDPSQYFDVIFESDNLLIFIVGFEVYNVSAKFKCPHCEKQYAYIFQKSSDPDVILIKSENEKECPHTFAFKKSSFRKYITKGE